MKAKKVWMVRAGEGAKAIDEFFDGLTSEERALITGGNAAKVYNVQ